MSVCLRLCAELGSQVGGHVSSCRNRLWALPRACSFVRLFDDAKCLSLVGLDYHISSLLIFSSSFIDRHLYPYVFSFSSLLSPIYCTVYSMVSFRLGHLIIVYLLSILFLFFISPAYFLFFLVPEDFFSFHSSFLSSLRFSTGSGAHLFFLVRPRIPLALTSLDSFRLARASAARSVF